MRVEFTKNTVLRDHNGAIEFEAKAGEVVDLEYHSAQRWIRRGRAQASQESQRITQKGAGAVEPRKTPATKKGRPGRTSAGAAKKKASK